MNPPTNKPTAKEKAALFGIIVPALLLLAALIAVPILAGRYGGTWAGSLVTLLLVPVWALLGPSPSRGYLNGIIYLAGHGCLIGLFIGRVIALLNS